MDIIINFSIVHIQVYRCHCLPMDTIIYETTLMKRHLDPLDTKSTYGAKYDRILFLCLISQSYIRHGENHTMFIEQKLPPFSSKLQPHHVSIMVRLFGLTTSYSCSSILSFWCEKKVVDILQIMSSITQKFFESSVS